MAASPDSTACWPALATWPAASDRLEMALPTAGSPLWLTFSPAWRTASAACAPTAEVAVACAVSSASGMSAACATRLAY